MSHCGRYQTAVAQANVNDASSGPGFIYQSRDFGRSWTQNVNAPSNGWYGIAVSGSGQCQLALPNTYKSAPLNGYLYGSNDFGMTWTPRTGPGEQLWLTGAMDREGRTQVATVFGTLSEGATSATPGNVYISRDFGWTWATVPSLSDYFTSVAVSACGRHITVGAQNCFFAPAIPKPLYVSNDGGVDWLVVNSNADNWLSVAMTADGKRQVALSYKQEPTATLSGYASESCDFGRTWARIRSLPQESWTSNAMSDDGAVQTLVSTLCGKVFQSFHGKKRAS